MIAKLSSATGNADYPTLTWDMIFDIAGGGPSGIFALLHLLCVIHNMSACQTIYDFHETCHSVTFHFMKKDSKRCCDTTTPESIHTKDESKRGSAFAFIFGVN